MDFGEELTVFDEREFTPEERLVAKLYLVVKATNGFACRVISQTSNLDQKISIHTAKSQLVAAHYATYREIGAALGISPQRLSEIVDYVLENEREL